jgi:hypothetical protein
MTLDTINETRTLLLLVPYVLLYFYYIKYVKDPFFIKSRADVQLLFMIYTVIIIFLELFAWSVIFHTSTFMGFNGISSSQSSDSIQTIGILIGAVAAIIGWLFTTRAQAIDSTKANTMKILMESRLSDEYSRNLKITTKIFTAQRQSNGDNCNLSVVDYQALNADQLDSVHYMLNYFEFIAVGIRCGDLDELYMRQTLRSIILTNYKFYKLIIEERQKRTPSSFENLVTLANRWD